ncbi:MAG: tetratricopeptide repeat protein [Acidobacteria bacterium]|nr:tetratricopeptide repeat protein [Acidobacteriota bacterium]MYF14976.1 tetratricopeptide repeat protein [Acidobacteriota bacterium]MYI96610.1 tetratricopeptide repeat protein [Acidobacteriota bacterium]
MPHSPAPVLRYALRPVAASVFLPATLAAAAAQPAPAEPAAELAALETAGSQLLFDYDFDEAFEHYARVSERFPEHPTGPYNLATTIWTRLAQRSNGMRGSSLRNDRFFSQQGRPDATPEEEAAFREHLEEAYRRGRALLERDPDDVEALYYLGASEALESGWSVIVDRAWFRAARQIRRGVGRHRRVQELDPGFRDAYAVPGAYDYGVATLPRPLRWLAFLFGIRGDRDGGLEGVWITADEGRRARWGGLWTWALLMQREEREDEALAAIRRLNTRFPKNPDFVLDEVSILTALGDFEAARELAERVLERREAGFGNYRLVLPGLAEARLGEALLFQERWEEAETVFSRGLAAEPNPEVQAILLFRRGNARDGAGQRGTALTDYGRVIRDDADQVLGEWAEELRRAPWPDAAPDGSHPAR